MLECITAVSTTATAIVATLTYFILRKQWAILQPAIKYSDSGDSQKEYRRLTVEIEKPDNIKYKLYKLTVISPPDARISKIISDTNNKPSPDDWKTELLIDYLTSSTGVFFKAPRGSEVVISVQSALKSDESIKNSCTITSKMHG